MGETEILFPYSLIYTMYARHSFCRHQLDSCGQVKQKLVTTFQLCKTTTIGLLLVVVSVAKPMLRLLEEEQWIDLPSMDDPDSQPNLDGAGSASPRGPGSSPVVPVLQCIFCRAQISFDTLPATRYQDHLCKEPLVQK